MKRKVLHLISSLSMGGAETLITDYALKIDKQKFDFLIVTISPRKNTVNESKLREAGIDIFFLGDKIAFPNAQNILTRMINKIHRYMLLRKIIKQERPAIIHTHLQTNDYIVPINTNKRNITLFHTIHNEIKTMFEDRKQNLATKYCIKRKGMIPIALHSQMQKEANIFFNIDSSLVLPNAIDVNRFSNFSIDKTEMFESLKISDNAFIIGHVGRFVEQKNHKFLIKVFATVKQKRPDAHLLLIGIGDLEDKIKEQVKELGLQHNVSFLRSRGDIPDLMAIMDTFVFPSYWEGFGNVLIEAQASGVKCVASDTIPEDAFVTNLATPLSLNDSIETWADTIINGKRPSEIRGNLEKHDINNVIKQLEDIYTNSIHSAQ